MFLKLYKQQRQSLQPRLIIYCLFTLALATAACKQKAEEKQTSVLYGNNAAAGKYADVNGIKMYYEIYGDGAPLVLVHGNGGSISSMRGQIAFFSKTYKVIAVDSRAQGKTNDNGDSLTYDQITGDINALLDNLKIDSAYMIGQSDGAIVGLIMAYKYPVKVKMLAAMSPNIRPDSVVLYPDVEAQGIKELSAFEDSLKAGHKEIMTRLKLLRLMQYHPHITTAELASIKAPVIIMTGDRDLIQLSHIIEIFREIPKSNLCVLPGSTHYALRQNAKVFNETIQHFFTTPFAMPNSFVAK
ncbi:MAG: alpha/beta hydrolase [Ferruginibacter sp.]